MSGLVPGHPSVPRHPAAQPHVYVRRTLVILSGPFTLALMAVLVRALPFGSGADELPALGRSAEEAVAEARRAGAGVRAPQTLAVAEDAYAGALLARRREELRVPPLRDYGTAAEGFRVAARRAREATRIARQDRDAERAGIALALESGAELLAPLTGVEEAVGLDAGTRARLRRARALYDESVGLLEAGSLEAARARAVEAAREAREVREEIAGLAGRYTDPDSRERWRSWVRETVAWSRRTGKAAVVVDKDEHRLVLYERGVPVRIYRADLGWNNLADKGLRADLATPEGRYRVTRKKEGPQTLYHRALLLDYPNVEDLAAFQEAKRRGRIAGGTAPGGLIEIHGEGGRDRDWTDGCVALANPDMDDLFARVAPGTPVTIVGTEEGRGPLSALAGRLGR